MEKASLLLASWVFATAVTATHAGYRAARTGYRAAKIGYRIAKMPFQIGAEIYKGFRG